MKHPIHNQKFRHKLNEIKVLGEKNSRFRRIYSEYEMMTEHLHHLEDDENLSIPDDFINAVRLQASYLEDEIEDWLAQYHLENEDEQ